MNCADNYFGRTDFKIGEIVMKNLAPLFAALLAAAALCGCHPTVTVNGNTYDALDEEEKEMLRAIAVKTLEKNTGKAVLDSELRFARAHAPEMVIDYYGDRTGEARLSWQMPTRKVTIIFTGEFLTNKMDCMMQTIDNQPEIINFTGGIVTGSLKGAVPPQENNRMHRSKSAIVKEEP